MLVVSLSLRRANHSSERCGASDGDTWALKGSDEGRWMMRRLMGESASEVPFVSVLRIRIPRFSFVIRNDGDFN